MTLPPFTGPMIPRRTILVLPGIARSGDHYNVDGLLDRPSACTYVERRGYVPHIVNIPGNTGPETYQTRFALRYFHEHQDVVGFYGFSGGAYNVRWVLDALTPQERMRIRLVVVLGAPTNPKGLYQGPWELIYRTDPSPTKGGHMAGPSVLLAELEGGKAHSMA